MHVAKTGARVSFYTGLTPFFAPLRFGFMIAPGLDNPQWFFLLTAHVVDHAQHDRDEHQVNLNELDRVSE